MRRETFSLLSIAGEKVRGEGGNGESSMSRKIATATMIVVALSSAAIFSTTPAAAMSGGEAAAIGLGAFAIGAVASGALNSGYRPPSFSHDCNSAGRPVYNQWRDDVGFRRERYCD
jgi:hypothetical protein